ncbi:ribosomal protein S18-alanine N-acetyltransferase [Aneurinibacillus sp. Ricciae_BoGa-3]|uniref:ribosomal protein S18-alanine N-acetyltransferase n=1 Tax=Aneurinibacillus sp. Ricciae_BoGa-3 TaxID=3022697 RepID=UPI00234183F4|nr:ribosomal protein S18-alanine N-acetyltransferase [Aneurinibacillus sp. Ricciae_BoGa-3]WCK55000.1 ribosomal protein S18-alanine N-acetyltransferase [Aneurinibacillus sp. Ricciae_BoGa-3]
MEQEKTIIRKMESRDLEQVYELEVLSFTIPWSYESFYNELHTNLFAQYKVVEYEGMVIGYAGMWLVIDEAHVTNVAIHPDFRGHHLGERLMREMMLFARRQGAQAMTLEVRKSNTVAQNLYQKLGFEAGGVRRGYYTDNNEDAIIMWVNLHDNEYLESKSS